MKKSLVKQLSIVSIALSATLLAATSAQAVTRSCDFTRDYTLDIYVYDLDGEGNRINQKRMREAKSFKGTVSDSGPTVLIARINAKNEIFGLQYKFWSNLIDTRRDAYSTKDVVIITGKQTVKTSGDTGCKGSRDYYKRS